MEDVQDRIATWASHGTLSQFRTEIDGYLKSKGYDSEVQGEELVIYRPRKQGGFLGIGAKTVKTPLMKISRTGGAVRVLPEPFDQELAQYLDSILTQH
jgi:hypothetical protein